jgi:pimeloyl-ACP methyl ester carboxylesterase
LTIGALDRISCPVVLATPQFDRVLPGPRHAPRYRREIPRVRTVTLPDCGHVPMWDDAKLVTRLIVEQIDSALDGGHGAQADARQPIFSASSTMIPSGPRT